MELTKKKVWIWSRGLAALLLAIAFLAAHVAHHGIRFGLTLGATAYLIAALASIYVSIWKQWDFEVVGWVLIGVFFFGITMS